MKVRVLKRLRSQPSRDNWDHHAYMRSVYKDRYGWFARARIAQMRKQLRKHTPLFPTFANNPDRARSLLDLHDPAYERIYAAYDLMVGGRLQVEAK